MTASSSSAVGSPTYRQGDSLPSFFGARQRGTISTHAFQSQAQKRFSRVFLEQLQERAGVKEYQSLIDRVKPQGLNLSGEVLVERLWVKEYAQLTGLSGYEQTPEWHAVVDPFLERGEPHHWDVEEYLQVKQWSDCPFTQLPKPVYAQPGETCGTTQMYLICAMHMQIAAAVARIT